MMIGVGLDTSEMEVGEDYAGPHRTDILSKQNDGVVLVLPLDVKFLG